MVLITVLASMLSIIYDAKWLAVLGIIGGFLTPVLLSTGQDNQIVLMPISPFFLFLAIAMYRNGTSSMASDLFLYSLQHGSAVITLNQSSGLRSSF
jgi:uncharacterized membrane protein